MERVPRSTMEATGSQNVDIRSSKGNPKLGCTVTLVITTDGRKGRAEVNFRGLAPDGDVIRQLQANAPDNVRVTGSPQGWARHQSLIEWLQALVVPFVAGATFLLLLDRYPAHRNQQFRDAITAENGTDTFIPGRCTSLLQPLDLTVKRSFKCHLRTIWKVWKIGHTDDQGHCERITRRDVVRMTSLGWERVTQQTIMNGWRASGLVPEDDDEVGEGVEMVNDELEQFVEGIEFSEGEEDDDVFDDDV
ncbi:uncharacterized protein LOC135502569 [Lineus longissimus]|uniref:uncharacterized protein LOC135502569 n=1 Tax=Lineus longissimus TaxID=88925 RepID=UPI00315DFBAF